MYEEGRKKSLAAESEKQSTAKVLEEEKAQWSVADDPSKADSEQKLNSARKNAHKASKQAGIRKEVLHTLAKFEEAANQKLTAGLDKKKKATLEDIVENKEKEVREVRVQGLEAVEKAGAEVNATKTAVEQATVDARRAENTEKEAEESIQATANLIKDTEGSVGSASGKEAAKEAVKTVSDLNTKLIRDSKGLLESKKRLTLKQGELTQAKESYNKSLANVAIVEKDAFDKTVSTEVEAAHSLAKIRVDAVAKDLEEKAKLEKSTAETMSAAIAKHEGAVENARRARDTHKVLRERQESADPGDQAADMKAATSALAALATAVKAADEAFLEMVKTENAAVAASAAMENAQTIHDAVVEEAGKAVAAAEALNAAQKAAAEVDVASADVKLKEAASQVAEEKAKSGTEKALAALKLAQAAVDESQGKKTTLMKHAAAKKKTATELAADQKEATTKGFAEKAASKALETEIDAASTFVEKKAVARERARNYEASQKVLDTLRKAHASAEPHERPGLVLDVKEQEGRTAKLEAAAVEADEEAVAAKVLAKKTHEVSLLANAAEAKTTTAAEKNAAAQNADATVESYRNAEKAAHETLVQKLHEKSLAQKAADRAEHDYESLHDILIAKKRALKEVQAKLTSDPSEKPVFDAMTATIEAGRKELIGAKAKSQEALGAADSAMDDAMHQAGAEASARTIANIAEKNAEQNHEVAKIAVSAAAAMLAKVVKAKNELAALKPKLQSALKAKKQSDVKKLQSATNVTAHMEDLAAKEDETEQNKAESAEKKAEELHKEAASAGTNAVEHFKAAAVAASEEKAADLAFEKFEDDAIASEKDAADKEKEAGAVNPEQTKDESEKSADRYVEKAKQAFRESPHYSKSVQPEAAVQQPESLFEKPTPVPWTPHTKLARAAFEKELRKLEGLA